MGSNQQGTQFESPREARGPSGSPKDPDPPSSPRSGVGDASIAALAALPTASALASAGSSRRAARAQPSRAVRPLVTPGELLSAGELQKLLSTLPLGDLSAAQLAHYLAASKASARSPNSNWGLLSSEELGIAGLEESLRKAIEQLGPSATLGELVERILPRLPTRWKASSAACSTCCSAQLPGPAAGTLEALSVRSTSTSWSARC